MENRANKKWEEIINKSIIDRIPSSKGIYALVFELTNNMKLSTRTLSNKTLTKGIYVYIGSARGPGGLRARIRRHLAKTKKLKWHIDYITSTNHFRARAIVYALTNQDLEHIMASILEKQLAIPIQRFGSTDKPSRSHLFKCNNLTECINTAFNALELLNLSAKVIRIT